jgi:hypothetical protein
MIKEQVITTIQKEKGETQEHIDICLTCKVPARKCNGECERFKRQAKLLRQTKRLKKNIIVF